MHNRCRPDPEPFVIIGSDDRATLDLVSQRLEAMVDLIEGSRALFNTAAQSGNRIQDAPPPRIDRLEFASPLLLEIGVPVAVAAFLAKRVLNVFLVAAQTRESWYRGTSEKYKAVQEEVKADRMTAPEIVQRSKTSPSRKMIESDYADAKSAVKRHARQTVRSLNFLM